jgi:hypothetical protein
MVDPVTGQKVKVEEGEGGQVKEEPMDTSQQQEDKENNQNKVQP